MENRNILVFMTAVAASILLLISIFIRLFVWYDVNNYGSFASLSTYFYIVPVALFWIGWYLNDIKSVFAASLLMVVNLYFHLENVSVLSGDPVLVSSYAPAIKTTYVLTLILIVAIAALGFVSYYLPKFKK